MKVSVQWLQEFVEVSSPEALAAQLTAVGLEVEGMDSPARALRGVAVAQVVAQERHPNADKLSVTQVEVAAGARLQVVCGAKNFKVGDKVPLATVGAVLPNGMSIAAAKLRGVESFGMLCSAKELGLAEESDGLLILDPGLPLGQPIAEALELNDTVLTLNVTPNRPDWLSHIGVAQEVAAASRTRIQRRPVQLQEASASAAEVVSVRIEDPRACPRYAARVLEGLKVGPSPRWLRRRLESCGIRSINNLVDVTNYVMLETGQPLHAFDLDRVDGGKVVVRRARPGETLVTLDEKSRPLSPEDLVVCGGDTALALAGVMGGLGSEVTSTTRRVLLECAAFDPAVVRRTAKRHSLNSESSHRFERGVDVSAIPAVLDRAAALLAEWGQGSVRRGAVDVYPEPRAAGKLRLSFEKLDRVLGTSVPRDDAEAILAALGFAPQANAQEIEVTVPLARVDVSVDEDLIEEIARVRGMDAIPAIFPKSALQRVPESAEEKTVARLHQAMSSAGMNEVVNYSFVDPKDLQAFGILPRTAALKNPFSAEQSVMRSSLLPSLLRNAVYNIRHQAAGLRLYEIARCYRVDPSPRPASEPSAQESLALAGLLWGARTGARTWTEQASSVDFFDCKAAVEKLLQALSIDGVEWASTESLWFHPRASAAVRKDGVTLGVLGELHPRLLKHFDLSQPVYVWEMEVEPLVRCAQLTPRAAPLSKFPSVFRDLAVVVPASLESRRLQGLIESAGGDLLQGVAVFDVYSGKPIPEGQKNMAFALTYAAPDRTLTDAEVATAHQQIVDEVGRRLGALLRG